MDSTPKQILKLRWPLILVGLGLILVCLIPGDLIITYETPSRTFHTQAWMHPFIWPFFGLGILYILAPFNDRLRRNVARITIATGILSLFILYGIESIIRIKLLEFWLNTTFANPDTVDVEISLLLIHWFIAMALIIVPLLYYLEKRQLRKWKEQKNIPFSRIP